MPFIEDPAAFLPAFLFLWSMKGSMCVCVGAASGSFNIFSGLMKEKLFTDIFDFSSLIVTLCGPG